jgi:hypothetical protein
MDVYLQPRREDRTRGGRAEVGGGIWRLAQTLRGYGSPTPNDSTATREKDLDYNISVDIFQFIGQHTHNMIPFTRLLSL